MVVPIPPTHTLGGDALGPMSLPRFMGTPASLEAELCLRTSRFVDKLDRLQRVFQIHPLAFEILTPYRGGV
jgi:hypothetical protein